MPTDLDSTGFVSPQQLRWLQTLHEGIARDLGAALSALLRSPAEVQFSGIEQATYNQFICELESPACFHLLRATPLDDCAMLDIEPSIVHPLIDCLLGGSQEQDPPPSRPLTEIELCLAARIVRLFLDACRRAWQDVFDLKLDVLQVEDNPRLLRALPADEPVLLIGFELGLGNARGMLRLCLPCRAIERLGDRLSPDGVASAAQAVSDALANVQVTLAETQITAAQLADLRVCDIIATETDAGAPATVLIEGAPRFRAKPGVYQGRKAVCLTEALDRPASTADGEVDGRGSAQE
jgi:flagellar motor switch protein FliM